MLHRVGHFTAKNVPGGWGISSHDNVENPRPHYSPRLGGWGLQLTAALVLLIYIIFLSGIQVFFVCVWRSFLWLICCISGDVFLI